MTQESIDPYCENCFWEKLDTYYVDSLGSIFCSEKCFLESGEYREADVESLQLVKR